MAKINASITIEETEIEKFKNQISKNGGNFSNSVEKLISSYNKNIREESDFCVVEKGNLKQAFHDIQSLLDFFDKENHAQERIKIKSFLSFVISSL